jgi:CAAX prenyl protease-like protein
MGSRAFIPDPARLTRAHVLPFAVFMGFLLLLQIAIQAGLAWNHPEAPWWRRNPAYFIYPVQTLVVLALLVRYWRHYTFDWSWKWGLAGVVFGAVGIGFWLLPSMLYDHLGLTGRPDGIAGMLGVLPRREGFDPTVFDHPAAWWTVVLMRFLRAVVVVALLEEIFWRGFMMRFVCDWEGDFWKQPFGKARWRSYLIVTALFVMAHTAPDRPAAFVYGSLTCVVMHATANLLMCLHIMATGKYGLW